EELRPAHVLFFLQAEDGIRDATVTGVQTCALPIYRRTGTEGVESARGESGGHRPRDLRRHGARPRPWPAGADGMRRGRRRDRGRDRKSTRLNSSHGSISYAVFCLKKKKK